MLTGQPAAGDKVATEDLHDLPAGTMVKSLGDSGWWKITEVPQVSELDQLALELANAWLDGTYVHAEATEPWRRTADYVLANFTRTETAVAEVAGEAVVYPERVRDADGDLWTLSAPGRYTWADGYPGQVNTANIHLADLVVNFGPIRAL